MLKTAQQNSSESEKLFTDHCTQLHTQTGELMCHRLNSSFLGLTTLQRLIKIEKATLANGVTLSQIRKVLSAGRCSRCCEDTADRVPILGRLVKEILN